MEPESCKRCGVLLEITTDSPPGIGPALVQVWPCEQCEEEPDDCGVA